MTTVSYSVYAMPDLPPRWQKLQSVASSMSTGHGWEWLKVRIPDQKNAIKLAHTLTFQLDVGNGLYRPSDEYREKQFTLEHCLAKAEQRIDRSRAYIFGEELPAGRNIAVRVERRYLDEHTLAASLLHELVERPDLEGGKRLREGFLAALEIVEF